ncbi:GrpE-domain-containing protein [Choiromyces venosus 120613-1]|uniref:GrpE protein homolog n=1 Tax=Choiromyces venosus 120613-1 TaxID=1336337 RepID=A0A3N4K4S1_9PEZI|nr:GrpE-domain-containing protein [Choiromyces venosus 120613-1]
MFRGAIIQGTRQFASANRGGIPRTSPALLSVRQWQVAPSYVRLRRGYSTEQSTNASSEENKNGATPAAEPQTKSDKQTSPKDSNGLTKEVEALKKDLEERTKEARDFKDRFQRAVADFRNLQDRTEREKKTARDFAIQKFAKDLVESVDNLDRALTTVPAESRTEENKDLMNLYNGLKMTEDVLLNTLKRHGLEKVDPMGQVFDPNKHEAVFQVPMSDKEPGTVFNVQQTGFALNGRTIRAAKVGVVAAAAPK